MNTTVAKTLSAKRKLLYAVIVLVWTFAAAEATLWIVGFEYRTGSVSVEDRRTGKTVAMQRSMDLGWELDKGTTGANEDGFVGARIPKKRTPGTVRIAALGDSCTQWGDPPYIEIARDDLAKRLGKPVESLNAGISGYSTHQGLARFKRDVAAYKPDYVVIYLGWNDHWVASGATDAGREVILHRPATRILWSLDESKVVQGATMLVDALRPTPTLELRVPLADYEANLKRIVEGVRGIEAVPILVTAPTNMTTATPWGDFAELSGLLESKWTSPHAIHSAYVESTRRVGKELGVAVVDAFSDFKCQPDLIGKDHIHPTQAGYERLAALIAIDLTQANRRD